jgi:hypothetical protein
MKFGTGIYTGRPEDLILALYRPSMKLILLQSSLELCLFFLYKGPPRKDCALVYLFILSLLFVLERSVGNINPFKHAQEHRSGLKKYEAEGHNNQPLFYAHFFYVLLF